jgi:PadR family transcriptional regulator PadR
MDAPSGLQGSLSQLRRGVLEYCVLALLSRQETYGFELVRRLSESNGMIVSEGTIYPLLGRLRRDGLVITSWKESTAGPARRYYGPTPEGEMALRLFAAEWSQFRDSVDQLLSKGPDR